MYLAPVHFEKNVGYRRRVPHSDRSFIGGREMTDKPHGQRMLSFLLRNALLVLFLVDPANAAVFTVNARYDGTDANPGNGVCETAPGNGICTLRAAIHETNALAGDDTIILPPNIYFQDALLTNEYVLLIAGNLTITGGGASTTIIEGVPKGGVVHINAGFTVKLSGVTIRGANVLSRHRQ